MIRKIFRNFRKPPAGSARQTAAALLAGAVFLSAAFAEPAALRTYAAAADAPAQTPVCAADGLPYWIVWEEKTAAAAECTADLSGRQARILRGEETVWESDREWLVQDMLLCDIDRDGETELLLLVWKQGNYGRFRPVWEEEDNTEYSQHIFIYDLDDDRKPRPLWMSSGMPRPVRTMRFSDSDGVLILTGPEGEQRPWRWEYFGLKLAEEITLPEETVRRESGTLRVMAAGDVIAHRRILAAGEVRGGDYSFLFSAMEETIRQADIACVNLETPLVKDGFYSDYPRFASPPGIAAAMAGAGFDIASCATNHMLDCGLQGILDTAEIFAALPGIRSVGIHPHAKDAPFEVVEKNGIRAAFLNFTYGTNGQPVPPEAPHCIGLLDDGNGVRNALRGARTAADIVIVLVHWGTEYTREPDEAQRAWTEVFLGEGVDLVAGTHPHVLQGAEMLTRADGHRMLVYYSLGNLVSGQTEQACRTGGIADVTFRKQEDGSCGIDSCSLIPVVTRRENGLCFAAPLWYNQSWKCISE